MIGRPRTTLVGEELRAFAVRNLRLVLVASIASGIASWIILTPAVILALLSYLAIRGGWPFSGGFHGDWAPALATGVAALIVGLAAVLAYAATRGACRLLAPSETLTARRWAVHGAYLASLCSFGLEGGAKFGLFTSSLFAMSGAVIALGLLATRQGPLGFPFGRLLAAAVSPPLLVMGVMMAARAQRTARVNTERRQIQSDIDAREAIFEREREAETARLREQEQREEAARAQEHAAQERRLRVDALRGKLAAAPKASTRCALATTLAREGLREARADLIAGFHRPEADDDERGCFAAALVGLGETQPAEGLYLEWARDGPAERRRRGVVGLCSLGPAAAERALPFLMEHYASPDPAIRQQMVLHAGKLGAAAEPFLRRALEDGDVSVRTQAKLALASIARARPVGP